MDPIRDGANWFAYVNNDPVNYIDLWGLLAGDLKTYQLDNFPQNFPVSPTVGTGDERLTSGYGVRRDPVTNQEGNKHGGIDFGVPTGTEILSVLDGSVQLVDNNHEIYGRYVDINHGNGITTRYAHLSEIYVKTGDTVMKATVIGLSGGNPDDPYSGKNTGSHLHFEQRINGESVDPFSSIFYFGMYTVSVEEAQ